MPQLLASHLEVLQTFSEAPVSGQAQLTRTGDSDLPALHPVPRDRYSPAGQLAHLVTDVPAGSKAARRELNTSGPPKRGP